MFALILNPVLLLDAFQLLMLSAGILISLECKMSLLKTFYHKQDSVLFNHFLIIIIIIMNCIELFLCRFLDIPKNYNFSFKALSQYEKLFDSLYVLLEL
jgi:hypothetical protein